ncbi:MAG TPA: uracil-DNA glycosylase [bacterium]|nr:uracil-DNA glycosylase [bacterium]
MNQSDLNHDRQLTDLLANAESYFRYFQAVYGDKIYLEAEIDSISLTRQERKQLGFANLGYEIRHCRRCELYKTRSQVVIGAGNPDSKILLIGEAPGFNEDKQGKPFVGEAGNLLDKILKSIHLRREDIYLTNVLKCRPPENRDPEPHEQKACLNFLMDQLELIQPRFILLLGRVAAQALLKTDQSLVQLRQKIHRIGNARAVVTYHPAALLRFPKYKRDTWEDVQIFQKLLRGDDDLQR